MVSQGAWQCNLDFFGGKPVVVEPVAQDLSSDAGLLPIREFDEKLGFTEQFAAALDDPRDPVWTHHSFLQMTRSRVYGILAGYEDQNDHDVLRSDPVFKLIADRSPDGEDLASQPTHSRFENAIDVPSLNRLQDVLIGQFIASFQTPPSRLTFDIDTYDDPAHGQQQLVLFHGYYNQYQYQPRVITCAQNDMVAMVCLLYGSARPSLGAEADLAYLVRRLRDVWPDLDIELRADSGFGMPALMQTCEELDVWYTIGAKLNPVLKRESAACLEEAVQTYERSQQKDNATPENADQTASEQADEHQPTHETTAQDATESPPPRTVRLFTSFWYRADSWEHPRFTIVKCEANAQGTNRRAIITNRPGAALLPEATYDEYANRGESENRNKELKCGLAGDRLSDHRYLANLFRLYLHTLAHNLLVRIRQIIADPPPFATSEETPTEALSDPQRKQFENQRRKRDPLGEGHPCTWRTRLIKVATEVVVSTRRIHVKLSGCWPFLEFYERLCQQAAAFTPPLPPPIWDSD
jgi:hypothetical protein